MDELRAYRESISDIDRQMAELFEKRMENSKKIAAYKQKNGLSVRDKKREEELIAANKDIIKDDEIRSYYVRFLKNTIDLSSDYQQMRMQGMKVAYSGVEGAFAYIAAQKMFPHSILVPYGDFTDAYRSVEKGECDCAVLPMENSLAGEVGTVMDLLYSGTLYVNQVCDLPVIHNLLGVPGASIDDITTVISHPQAISQCGRYIGKKSLSTESAANTAVAAKMIAEKGDKSIGAIASETTASIYGLSILDHDIQDSGLNSTRFAAFSRSMNTQDSSIKYENESFILVFTVKNEAGALAATLNIIGAHGYNMRSLKSRPMKDLSWNYFFYIEAEGNIHTSEGRDMMRELSVLCAGLKLVGTYH